MPRYIDADALLKYEIEADHMGAMLVVGKGYILSAPEVDAAPVVRGEWLNFTGDYSVAECSNCGEIYEVSPDEKPCVEYLNAFKQFYNYCPSCGADNRGSEVKE